MKYALLITIALMASNCKKDYTPDLKPNEPDTTHVLTQEDTTTVLSIWVKDVPRLQNAGRIEVKINGSYLTTIYTRQASCGQCPCYDSFIRRFDDGEYHYSAKSLDSPGISWLGVVNVGGSCTELCLE